ncbi:MAG: FAD-binding oxidoreductase [Candidatus Paceibacterota bacterium]
MFDLTAKLKTTIKGEVASDAETLKRYSRDTSLFEVKPQAVVFPADRADIESLVRFVNEHKPAEPSLSLTARSAGTDMTGGPLNDSIILSLTEHLNRVDRVDEENLEAVVEPGVFYRDFEEKTLPKHISLPTYPASKSIAALGGMIANNSGGEKTLRYGKTADYVKEMEVVLADGESYTLKSLSPDELEEKKKQTDFEGELYRRTHDLLENNFDIIQKARPDVSKNSAGYALWRVWDRQHFDLTQLFCGAQGTLGIITKAKLRLIKDKPKRRLIALFFNNWDELPAVVNALLPHDPEGLEAFDDETLKLGLRFMPEIAKRAGRNFFAFAWQFWPEVLIGIKMLGLPKLIVLVQLAEDSEQAIDIKTAEIKRALAGFRVHYRVLLTETEANKYWVMRRQSFALLREHVKGKKTAPFIEDFCVKPEVIPEFLPQAIAILREHGIKVNIAGHAGNGNFHIIPLMDLRRQSERDKITVVADKFYDLVVKYKGSITAEHNDGIIRTPYLEKMYGTEIYDIFRQVKQIFDPQNIFNPGKKIGGDIAYLKSHIAKD